MDLSEDRTQTELYCQCTQCGHQWQVRSFADPPTDAQGCNFCGAPAEGISILSEAKDFSGTLAR